MVRTRRLLLITPTMPAETGNGLAMRAGLFLDALSPNFEITLLVFPIAGLADEDNVPGFVSERVVQTLVQTVNEDRLFSLLSQISDPLERAAAHKLYPAPALCRFATEELVAHAAARLRGEVFDVVHVMRLYMAPYARLFHGQSQESSPLCVLDLDDDEVETHMRLSALYARNGDSPRAMMERDEAEKYQKLAEQYLPKFSSVLVTSALDQARTVQRYPLQRTDIIPNAVHLPNAVPDRHTGAEFRILMVGTMGYYPNEEGALFFCREVLPVLREESGRDVYVDIVGGGLSLPLQQLNELAGVSVTGYVESVSAYYSRAHMAIVPLRAGGGTRIKLLEAFAHLTPVVSTSLGAEGVEVDNGKHLLIADGVDDFVAACLRIMRNEELGGALTHNAYALVSSSYSRNLVAKRIQDIYASLPWGQ